ncbi:MAG: hypothetical protein PVG41_00335 [Desulfobacteraceae bacterium]
MCKLSYGWMLILLPCLMAATADAKEKTNDQWFASGYIGQYSDTAFNEIIRFNTEFESSYVHVLSVGKELGVYKDKIQYELEAQVSKHTGDQEHEEINAVFTLRWLPFWWDDYLDTSFAFGNGISYATEDPPLEIRDSDDDETSKWLYYFLVEMAFVVPKTTDWDLFMRIHHRSSVFGAIDNVIAGSNFVGLGLRYRF